jgi:dihydroneopterin aldolase
VNVELHGLEVFGYHGVLESEQREGQTFLYDVSFEVAEPLADRVEETIDYRHIAAKVEEVSDSGSFALIESLAAAVADALFAAFPVVGVTVRVRKPRAGTIPVEWAGATVSRPR